MKKEHEVYFAKKMHVLADKFNAVADAAIAPDADEMKVVGMMADLSTYATDLETEFEQTGYSRKEWDALLKSSGAAARLEKR